MTYRKEKENSARAQNPRVGGEERIWDSKSGAGSRVQLSSASPPPQVLLDLRPKQPPSAQAQGLTCLSLSCSILARRFRSGGERYFCVSNFFSSSIVWSLENLTWPPFLLCRGLCKKGLHSTGLPSATKDAVSDGPGTRTGRARPTPRPAW